MLKILTAAVLALLGIYLAVRLLELDRINKETPNQEDPLFEEDQDA